MATTELEQEYQEIVKASREKGEVAGDGNDERRVHPRLKVQTKDLWSDSLPEFSVLDMSMSGFAIHSNHPLEVGEHIHISLGDALSVNAEVVRCELDEPPTEYLDAQFRIQCKFSEEYSGMELLVKVKKQAN